jgi:hypothetical protein
MAPLTHATRRAASASVLTSLSLQRLNIRVSSWRPSAVSPNLQRCVAREVSSYANIPPHCASSCMRYLVIVLNARWMLGAHESAANPNDVASFVTIRANAPVSGSTTWSRPGGAGGKEGAASG